MFAAIPVLTRLYDLGDGLNKFRDHKKIKTVPKIYTCI